MRVLITIILILTLAYTYAQSDLNTKKMKLDGHVVTAYIDECGDTIILAELDDISVTSLRNFNTQDEFRTYRKYRRYANKVYPYAMEAIKIFKEVESATDGLSRRKRKKHVKKLNKKLKKEFEDPLKKLTKTQGKILMKMIERELDTPMFYLIKNVRGGINAAYWNSIGYVNGYRLKSGYIRGEDVIMDAVLDDFDISYDL